jgi:hypothetical protein
MIEDDPFSVADYLQRAAEVRDEADALRTAREAAAAGTEVP